MRGIQLDNYFRNGSFAKLEVNSQISGYAINDNNNLKICIVVDNTGLRKYSAEELSELELRFRQNMYSKGYDSIDILFLIYTENVERDREAIKFVQVWLLDVKSKQAVIYDNQPQEFAGLGVWIETIAFRSENKRKRHPIPIISLILILINALVFVLLEIKGSTLDVYFMLDHGASSWQHEFKEMEIYRLFTCMFIHFGVGHLMNNMIMLYMIGAQIERLYGRFRFLFIYLSTGLIASMASSVVNMIMGKNDIVSGGASGAIYGIMGAMVIALWNNRKRFGNIFYRVIMIIVLMVYGGFTETGVDNVAHLGGFISGLIIGEIIYMTIRQSDTKNAS